MHAIPHLEFLQWALDIVWRCSNSRGAALSYQAYPLLEFLQEVLDVVAFWDTVVLHRTCGESKEETAGVLKARESKS